jgi:hypothetical protein
VAKKTGLLIDYVEGLSWKIMEDYPDVVRTLMRGRSGVYALYMRDKLYYAGLASNMMGRINAHIRDRHKGLWDRFSVYLTPDDQYMRELEALLLRIAKPRGNRVSGRFRGATDLNRSLHKAMFDQDADRRAQLLGGFFARKRRRAKTLLKKGTQVLKGLVERRVALRGQYKGRPYRGTLRKDGRVSYAGNLYDSPSAAAIAIIRRSANGWVFWKYKTRAGWVPLDRMRR